jgi:hypothetical protein
MEAEDDLKKEAIKMMQEGRSGQYIANHVAIMTGTKPVQITPHVPRGGDLSPGNITGETTSGTFPSGNVNLNPNVDVAIEAERQKLGLPEGSTYDESTGRWTYTAPVVPWVSKESQAQLEKFMPGETSNAIEQGKQLPFMALPGEGLGVAAQVGLKGEAAFIASGAKVPEAGLTGLLKKAIRGITRTQINEGASESAAALGLKKPPLSVALSPKPNPEELYKLDIGKTFQDITQKITKGTTDEKAAKMIGETIMKAQGDYYTARKKGYDLLAEELKKLNTPTGSEPMFAPTKTIAKIDEYLADMKAANSTMPSVKTKVKNLMNLRKELSAGGITYPEALGKVKVLNAEAGTQEMAATGFDSKLRAITHVLDEESIDALKNVSEPAYNAARKAKDTYIEGLTTFGLNVLDHSPELIKEGRYIKLAQGIINPNVENAVLDRILPQLDEKGLMGARITAARDILTKSFDDTTGTIKAATLHNQMSRWGNTIETIKANPEGNKLSKILGEDIAKIYRNLDKVSQDITQPMKIETGLSAAHPINSFQKSLLWMLDKIPGAQKWITTPEGKMWMADTMKTAVNKAGKMAIQTTAIEKTQPDIKQLLNNKIRLPGGKSWPDFLKQSREPIQQ